MQRKLAGGLALVVVIAGFLGYWYGIRDRGPARPKAVATEADPWAKPRVAKAKDDQPASNQGDRQDGRPRFAHETDPVGTFVLDGQVLDEDERAVAGAVVRISANPTRTATTNATGEFKFDKLLGRTYELTARAGSKLGGPVRAKRSSPDPVVIRLRQATSLEVTVLDKAGKKAVAGAKVMVLADDADETLDEAVTGADGVARFAVGAGWTRLLATADGYGPATGIARVGRNEKTAQAELTLVRGAALSGRVVDEQRQPIAGAKIWPLDAANAWMSGGGELVAVTSAADGSFTFAALPAGSWILFAKDETHAQSSTKPITVGGSAPVTGVEIVMATAATIAGVVVDAADAPVPYASVELSSDRWSVDMTTRAAAADGDGKFVIRTLPRRSFKLRATSDQASSTAIAVDLTNLAEKKDVKLVLDRTGTIAGIVVDSEGQGVAEAEVSAAPDFLSGQRGDNDWILSSGDTTTTDGDGRFTVRGLEDGQYRLFAVRDAGGVRQRGDRSGTVAKVGATDVRLTLPTPGAVVGKVVLVAGGTPTSAVISAGWENRTSTKDGNFRLGELRPATYDVRISGSEFTEVVKRDVVVTAGKEVDLGTITVRPGRKVSGKVVDGKGAPIAGARVMMGKLLFGDGKRVGNADASQEQPGVRQTVSDGKGEFTIVGASRSGGSLLADDDERGRSVAIDVPAGPDDVAGLSVQLKGFGSIAGKVTRKGEPLAGATVSAAPTGASGQAVFVSAGTDGSFVFDKLPAGPTTLLAMNMGMMRAASGGRDVTVIEAQQVDGSVTIPVGDISLTVHVKPMAGAQVSGAQVFLFHGAVTARTGLEVSNVFLARRGVKAEPGTEATAVGVAAGMAFWLGAGEPKFDEIQPGAYTLCGIPFTGAITDQQMMERLMRNLDKIVAVCVPITIAATPKTAEVNFELPQMSPLPEDAE